MKKKEKRMILIILLVSVVIIAGLLIWKNSSKNKGEKTEENTVEEKYVDTLDDGTKLNKSNKLKETKKLGELEITGIQLTYANGIAVILGNVTNTGNKDIDLTPIELTLYDDQGNELEKLDGIISPVKAGETVQLNIGISADYSNAYDFKIEKK